MKCPKCQAENADDAKFCSLCFARFSSADRSREADEAGRELAAKHKGSQLRCPSCGTLSPLESPFCLECAFVFENPESMMVDAGEVERLAGERSSAKSRELEEVTSTPLILTGESDGTEIMRHVKEALERGYGARIHASGRNHITHVMKVIALFSEDSLLQVSVRVKLISEGVVIDLDDVALEIIVEGKQGG
jgi:Double zinc ribbon